MVDRNKLKQGVRTVKARWGQAIRQTLRQFCEHTTLHGYKYLIDSKRHPLERFAWFLLLASAFLFALWISLYTWCVNIDKPTVTSLQSQRYPVWKVPFPSVGICSINRISKQAVRSYAEELVSRNPSMNLSGTIRQMRYFGRLYDFNEENFNDLLHFQAILDRYDHGPLGVFDVFTRMSLLTPRCSDLLMKCQWEGRDIDCSEIFTTRLTAEGFCCTFNNVRPSQTLSFSQNTRPIYTCQTGPLNGLTVLLNTSTSDYFYPNKNTLGFTVTITNPSVFVDESVGRVQPIIVPKRTEAFISLNVRTVLASEEVAHVQNIKRACMFEHELPDEYGGYYSFNDCLTKCKVHHYITLCGCVPFNLPTNFPDFGDEKRSYFRCNLSHIKCLNQFKITLNTFKPLMMDSTSSLLYNAVQCPTCLPMCSKTTYDTDIAYSRIVARNYKKNTWGIMRNVSRVNNVSIVRIFYPYVTSVLFTTNVVYTWQEIIAFYGGLLGLFMGFSIVGFMEIAYFSTVRFLRNIVCPHSASSNQTSRNNGGACNILSYKEVEQELLRYRLKASKEADKHLLHNIQ